MQQSFIENEWRWRGIVCVICVLSASVTSSSPVKLCLVFHVACGVYIDNGILLILLFGGEPVSKATQELSSVYNFSFQSWRLFYVIKLQWYISLYLCWSKFTLKFSTYSLPVSICNVVFAGITRHIIRN